MNPQTSSLLPFMLLGSKDGGSYNWWMIILIILGSIGGELILYMKKKSLSELIRGFFITNQKVYTIKADITKKNNIIYGYDIPIAFSAVMHVIENKVSCDPMINYTITERALTYSRKVKLVQFSNRFIPYKITNDICVIVDSDERLSDRGDFTFMTYTIQVMSESKDMNSIMSFIEQSIEEYDGHQESLSKNKLKIFTLTGFDKETEQKTIYHEVPFDTTKTFDTMFFEEKQMLKDRVYKFQSDKDMYKRLGIPYTLGMLFSGKPGTGKTSAIKALAKYTQRHVIRVPVKLIEDAECLQYIFLSERINNFKIPMDKRLYVFEEIDCTAWKNVVTSRKLCPISITQSALPTTSINNDSDNKISELTDSLKQFFTAEDNDTKKISKPMKPSGKSDLTLGDLLDILDGIVEMPGRMMVMTSNHPERLDEALLRPGRVDIKLEFKSLRKVDVCDMYKLWFSEEIPDEVAKNINDYTFTQADIGNLFSSQDKQTIFKALGLKSS